MSEEQKGLLDHAVAAATSLDIPTKNAVMKEWTESRTPIELIDVDLTLPKRFDAEGFPVGRKQLEEAVESYIRGQTMIMLTGSCFIGTGNEPTPGKAFSLPFIEEQLKTHFNAKIRRSSLANRFEVTSDLNDKNGSINFTITDIDKHLCGLRALHFLFTRNDPDLREYIIRMTNEDLRKMAEEDLKAAAENTQAPAPVIN